MTTYFKNFPILYKIIMLILIVYVPTVDEDGYGMGHSFLWETDYTIQTINYFAQLGAGAILCLILTHRSNSKTSTESDISNASKTISKPLSKRLEEFIKSDFVAATAFFIIVIIAAGILGRILNLLLRSIENF